MARSSCSLLSLLLLALSACGGTNDSVDTRDGAGGLDAGGDAPVREALEDGQPDPGTTDTPPDAPADVPSLVPPALSFVQPPLGVFATDCDQPLAVRVAFSGGVPPLSVTVNGAQASVGESIADVSLRPSEGLTLLEATASGADGARAREHRAVLCGQYAPPEALVAEAADLYLGRAALAALASLAAHVMDGIDASSRLAGANPIYEDDLIRVDAVRLTWDPGTLIGLTPGAGDLSLQVGLAGLRAGFELTLKGSTPRVTTLTVGADAVRADATARMALDAQGEPEVTISDLVFDVAGLSLWIDEDPDDVLAVLPSLRDLVVDFLELFLAGLVKEAVPPAVEAAFARLDEPFDLEILGHPFALRFLPSLLELAPEGLHLALDLSLEGLEPDPAYQSPGVLWTPGNDAWPKGLSGFRLSIRDELLNVALHETWRSGLLAFSVDQEWLDARKLEIDLVAGFLGGVLDLVPEAPGPHTPIRIELAPIFPPVASLDLPVAGGVRLGLGDMGVRIWADSWSWLTPLLPLTLTVRAELRLEVQGARVGTTIDALDLALDVASDDPAMASAEASLESVADNFLGLLGPSLTDLIADIPLPVPEGLHAVDLRVGSDPVGGTLLIEGDLE